VTLLETLLAFAGLSTVLIGLYGGIIKTSRAERAAQTRLEDTEFARSLLEEYVITSPNLPKTETYSSRWSWEIRETPYDGPEENPLPSIFTLIKITALIENRTQNAPPVILSTIVVRRAR
jgi:hypothetical protein